MSETKTDRLCRTCMNDSNSHSPIYREVCLENSILFEVINDVCQLEVTEGDGLPEYICHDCLAKLSEFQKFKCRAHDVNVALQRMKEHELNSELESVPWESCKTEDETNFEQENDGSGLGSKELCGSTLALHHDWIKADVKSEFSDGNASYCGSSNLMQPNEESVADPDDDDDDHPSYPPDYSATEHEKDDVNPAGVDQEEVKVEPEDSFDKASDGREHTLYEEYIGIEPDDLACNVGFDGMTPATTDPLQVPMNVTELKQESFSPERSHPTKDTFLTDGLKEEDLSPEAVPVEVNRTSTHSTLEEEGKGGSNKEVIRQRVEMVTNTDKEIGGKGKLINKSEEESNSPAASGRCRKISANNQLEGKRRRKGNVCNETHHVVIQNANLEKAEMKNNSSGGVAQDGSRLVTQLGSENLTGEANVKDLKRTHSSLDQGKRSKSLCKQSRFFCDTCGNGFCRKRDLMFHIRIHTGEKPFRGDICSKAFSSKNNFKEHVLSHGSERPNECHLCGKRFTYRSGLTNHLKTHLEKKYGCAFCERRYFQKEGLIAHLTTHSDEKPFLCNVCGKTFKFSSGLWRHLDKVHEGVKRHRCDICGKEFFGKCDLDNHIKLHDDERPYACEVCDKTFKTRERARSHQRTHSGLKPHSCTFCTKRFLCTGNLKVHLRTHTGEMPFECANCGRRFNHSSSLSRHNKKHCKKKTTL